MTKAKKVLSLLLCLVMVLSFFPVAALAEDAISTEKVTVEFVCDPTETIVTVYDPADLDENGQMAVIDPEEDGSYLLFPGNYLYDAECEGYAPVKGASIVVEHDSGMVFFSVDLLSLENAEKFATVEEDPELSQPEKPYTASTYDRDAAVSYVASKTYNNVDCTVLVGEGLVAGGITSAPVSGTAIRQFEWLFKNGYATAYSVKTTSSGNIKSSENTNIKKGDVIFYCCGKCGTLLHVELVSGFENGYVKRYGCSKGLTSQYNTTGYYISDCGHNPPYSTFVAHVEDSLGSSSTGRNQFFVNFNGNGKRDGGNMEAFVSTFGQTYTFPECGYTSNSYQFVGWELLNRNLSESSFYYTGSGFGASSQKKVFSPGDTLVFQSGWNCNWFTIRPVWAAGATPTEITFSGVCAKSGSASGSAVTSVAKDQAILYGVLTYGNDNKPDYFNLYLGTKQNQLTKLQINDNSFSDTTLSNNYPNCAFWVSFKDGSTDIDTNPLVAGTTYYYQFEAVSRSGTSYFSEVKSFKTTGTAPTYTVSYNANGGTGAPASQTKTYAVDLTLSSTKPSRANASAGSYTVTLNPNDGSVSPSSLTAARTTSYSFKNWNTKADGSGTSYASGASYTANAAATLYAQWNSSTSTAAVTLPTPTKTGYSFQGWNTKADGTGTKYNGGASYTPTGNVTLYAIWKANTYTVSYNANGGTGAPAAQTKTHDVALTLSSTKPTRANASAGSYTVTLNPNDGSVDTTSLTAARTTSYSFKNWNTAANGSGTSYASGASYTANAAATLYAQWNSSTSTAAVTLPTPTKTGYSFQGWNTKADGTGTKYNGGASYTPTGNVTLYAIWQANTYTVSYNANGGTGAPAAQTKTHDVALTLSSTKPSRANASAGNYTVTLNPNGGSVDTTSLTAARTTSYSFKNWNTKADGSGTSYASGASYTANAAATLYAQWNSSTSTAAVTLPTPTKTGYSFKGWATSASATSGSTGSYTPTGDVTLYAIWEQETNAKLVVDGGRVRTGQEIQVPIRLQENPGVVSIEISVIYDETVLEWTGVAEGEYGGTFLGEVGDTLTWYAADPAVNETEDGVFVTLTFRAKEDAPAGTTQISVSYEEDDIYNADEVNQPFGVQAGEIEIFTYIPGDINGDGLVNNKDVTRLQRYLKGQNVEVVEAALDVNGDGKINNKDATRLQRYLKYGDVEIY